MNTLYYGDNLKILQDRNYFPDAFGLDPIGRNPTGRAGVSSASPLAERKSSAFPSGDLEDQSGSAADPRQSLEDTFGDPTAKHSFAARQGEKGENPPTYRIIGEPEDLEGARQLASEDRYQFQ